MLPILEVKIGSIAFTLLFTGFFYTIVYAFSILFTPNFPAENKIN